LKLEEDIPYIDLKPHPHRRLKTASSEREIPLVGLSLWATKRLKLDSTGLYCFPRYTNPERCNSNSASAAINKWIKTVGGSNDVIHGLRHSFRDRLRAVEAPTDMIDQLGGWALKSVGQGYGDGYDLELLLKYMDMLLISQDEGEEEVFYLHLNGSMASAPVIPTSITSSVAFMDTAVIVGTS
jgi:integrase